MEVGLARRLLLRVPSVNARAEARPLSLEDRCLELCLALENDAMRQPLFRALRWDSAPALWL